MGGRSKSSKSSTTTSVSGQQSINGDNLGTNLTGVNGSTINVTSTDYGTVDKSFEFANDAMSEAIGGINSTVNDAFKFGEDIVQSNERALDGALSFGGDALKYNDRAVDKALSFGGESLEAAFDFGEASMNESYDFAGESMRRANDLANDSLGMVGKINGQSIDFAGEALDTYSELNEDSLTFAYETMDNVSKTNTENLQMLAGMSAQQASSNAANIGSLMELAKFKQDGGTSVAVQDNKKLVGFVGAGMALVTIASLYFNSSKRKH